MGLEPWVGGQGKVEYLASWDPLPGPGAAGPWRSEAFIYRVRLLGYFSWH